MNTAYTLPAAPQTTGRLLDAGTRLYLHALERVLPLALAGQLMLQLPGLLALALHDTTKLPVLPLVGAGLIGVVVTIVMLVLFVVLYLAVVARMWSLANGQDISAGAAFDAGGKAGVPFVIGGLLYLIATIVGIILLVIPGIYLGLSLILYGYLVITENLPAVAALKRSHALIRGQWWRVATIVTVPLVLMLSLLLVAQLLPMFFFGVDLDRKSTRLNSSHIQKSRMPSSA